jgi:hypothetical protein
LKKQIARCAPIQKRQIQIGDQAVMRGAIFVGTTPRNAMRAMIQMQTKRRHARA